MWLSLNILNKMVDISDIDPDDIAHRLTMCTAETESIEYLNQFLKTIITAQVTSVKKHPDADKLTLVDVDTGSETVRVVCGAPNHKSGDIVALATVGTVFSEEFKIKKSKIRGEESQGMLCSERELGFSESHEGIMILPQGTPLGKPLSELFPDYLDTRIEIDNKSITHRPDLWSHHGFARELGTLYDRPVKNPVDENIASQCTGSFKLNVSIDSPEEAPRYSALVVKNITIGESPQWLKAAVSSIGMRPISNIVDITNYIMAELGQPMHAFDAQKLRGTEIIVRCAKKDETIKTLDEKDHKLLEQDVLITDKNGPIAIAGVMGGANSEIDENTTEIILESANFNPVNTRRTAARLNSRTDAAMRFEKSLTPEQTVPALLRCFELIKEIIPEAEANSAIVDAYPHPLKDINITVTTDHIRKSLGIDISDESIIKTLTSLEYTVANSNGTLTIDVPHYRATKDISIAADIVEEIGRIQGYDNIPPSPPLVPCATPVLNAQRMFERQVKDILTNAHHMIEVSNYSFVGEEPLNLLNINEDMELRLQNPLSKEQDRLRRGLIPNMMLNIQTNQRHHDEFALYEIGRAYIKEDRKSKELLIEENRLAGCVYMKKTETPVFYESKLIASGLIEQLKIANATYSPVKDNLPPYAHPGRSMEISVDGKRAGLVFELHPDTIRAFDIQGNVSFFDLSMDSLFGANKINLKFKELQRYPEVPFEISVVTDAHTYAAEIFTIIKKSDKSIQDIEVVSVYEGAPIPEGKKSISFKIIFVDPKKTLESARIEELQNKVIKNLNKAGFELR